MTFCPDCGGLRKASGPCKVCVRKKEQEARSEKGKKPPKKRKGRKTVTERFGEMLERTFTCKEVTRIRRSFNSSKMASKDEYLNYLGRIADDTEPDFIKYQCEKGKYIIVPKSRLRDFNYKSFVSITRAQMECGKCEGYACYLKAKSKKIKATRASR